MSDAIGQDVAVIGAGIMGSAIATRLIETGNAVTIYDLDPVKVAALVAIGATAAASVADAARRSRFIILSLNHASIVRSVVFGAGGVAEGASAYKLLIDFGPEIGTRRSSAQLTKRYSRGELEGRLVLAVVNFPPRQIGPFMSEVLTLGVPDEEGNVVLLVPDKDVPIGGRLF